MTDAPERIWAIEHAKRGWNDIVAVDDPSKWQKGVSEEYVRADIHEALTAERDALREVRDLLLQHANSLFGGPDFLKARNASLRGVVRKAKKTLKVSPPTKETP